MVFQALLMSGNLAVTHRIYSKANELAHTAEKMRKDNPKSTDLPKIEESIKKLKSSLNEEGNTLFVPRCVMEIGKCHDQMRKVEGNKDNRELVQAASPKATAELAKSIVGLQNASNRFQEVTETINEDMRDLMRNTEKCLTAKRSDDVKQKDKLKSDVRKAGVRAAEMKTGEDDSVEKYYYSEFTEGSNEGHVIGRDKEAANRLELVKIRDAEEDKDIYPLEVKGEPQHGYSSENKNERKGKSKPNSRKSRMDAMEENIMEGDNTGYKSEQVDNRDANLEDDSGVIGREDSDTEDRRFGVVEKKKNSEEAQGQDSKTNEEVESRNNRSETQNNDSDIYDSEGNVIDKDEEISGDYSRDDSKGSGEDNRPTLNKSKERSDYDEDGGYLGNQAKRDGAVVQNRDDLTEQAYYKAKNTNPQIRGIYEEEENGYKVNKKDGSMGSNRHNSIKESKIGAEILEEDEDEYENENIRIDSGHRSSKLSSDNRDSKKADKPYRNNDEDKIDSDRYSSKKSTDPRYSSRQNSERDSRGPISYHDDDDKSRNSSKGGRLEDNEDGQKSSSRKKQTGSSNRYESDKDPKQYSEEGYYRKNTNHDGYQPEPDEKDRRVIDEEAYYHNYKKPHRINPEEVQATESGYYGRGRSHTFGEEPTKKNSNRDKGKKPKDNHIREGEIIVAEIEEGKSGNQIRFSMIEPNGRKSIIQSKHIIDPTTEAGAQFYIARKSVIPLENAHIYPEGLERAEDQMYKKKIPAESILLGDPTYRQPEHRAFTQPYEVERDEDYYKKSNFSSPAKRASALAPASQNKSTISRKSIILDGRSKDPKNFNKETVVFPRESVIKTLHAQDPIDEERDDDEFTYWHQGGGQLKDHAVERLVPRLKDPKQFENQSKKASVLLDSERDRQGTSSAYSSSQMPNSPRSRTDGSNIPSMFQTPIMKPLNTVEDRKSYFIQNKEIVEGLEVPRVVEVDYVYFRLKDDKPEPNHDPDINPHIDPCESFYQEADQARKDVPKIPGEKIYERRIRKLKPEEIEKREEEFRISQIKLSDPNLIPCEKLEKTNEWAGGKPVLIKKIDFIKNPNPVPPKLEESALKYYKMIEKNNDFNESVVYHDSGIVTSRVVERDTAKPDNNYFDSFTEPVISPLKFMIAQGPDGAFRVFQLEEFEGNPLIETETGGKFSLPSEMESSAKEGVRTMYRHSGTFHDQPILEPQRSRVIDISVLNVPRMSQLEFSRLTNKKILGPEELAKFLEMACNIPDAKVELYKQSPDALNGHSIVEQGLVLNSLAPDEKSRLLKQISELQSKGKLKSEDVSKIPKVQMAESIRLSTLDKSNKTKSSLMKEKKINAVQLEETYQGRPLYHIKDSSENPGQAKTTPSAAENYETRKNPIEELKEEMDKTENISEIQPLYNNISQRCIDENEDVKQQKKELNKLYEALVAESKQRGQPIEDWMFLPNGTSMVNNSLKSEIPYKDCQWMKLSDLYKVA